MRPHPTARRRLDASRFTAASVLAFALAWTFSSPVAHAQEAPDRAQETFTRGLAALQGNRFHDAVEAMETSWALRPLSLVSYNLGLAYRGLGRNVDAVTAFERYLRSPEPEAPPERLDALRREVARLRGTLVTLRVALYPTHATLRVDGRPVVLVDGETVIDPGARTVDVTAEDHQPAHRELDLAPGARASLEVRLTRVEDRGRLLVEPSVAESAVYVDQRLVGVGRTDVSLDPGRHSIEVRALGHVPYRNVIWSTARGVIRVSASLQSTEEASRRGRTPGWVLPVAFAGGAAVVAGVVVLVSWLVRGVESIPRDGWDVFCEAGCAGR